MNISNNYENRKKDLPVYSQRIAGYLMLYGHRLYNVTQNTKYNDNNVFYFRDCQEVRDAIEEIKEILSKENK